MPGSTSLGPRLNIFKNQSGQLVVEYVLLLLVAVSLAFAIRTTLVKGGDSPDQAGAVQQRWQAVGESIGKDDPNNRSQ
jgi:hypothetical protein